jgi:RNA ligase (TIGR02306 family)
MRKLVTIRRIGELHAIPDADLIERARIDGWNVVVKKGEFQAGDLCVYGEIDSVFPAADARFAFLEGKRLKTKKMRGVVSQGIAFPLSILGDVKVNEGDEVTEILGVTKYEPPPPKSMEAKGEFPWFIPKTDAERVQNLTFELAEQIGNHAFATEKLDGSSLTVFARLDETGWNAGVCSRNLELKLDVENVFISTVKRFLILDKLHEFCLANDRQLALQGELIGAGVQGNKYKLPATEIRFFNVFDITAQKYLPLGEFREIIRVLNLETVPILDEAVLLHDKIENYLETAEGKSLLNEKTEREGIVFRTHDGNFSFKAISNRFLLKTND